MNKKQKTVKQKEEVFKIKDIFNLKDRINIFYLMILFLPIIDLITALQTRFINFPLTLGVLVKGLLLLYIIYYLLFKSNSKKKKLIVTYLITLLAFWVVYLLTKPNIDGLSNYLKEITNLFKFSFYPVLVVGLVEMDNEKIIDKNKITKILSFSLIGYIIFILFPYITGTGFRSYGLLELENGTTGWFYAANEIGSILSILIVFTYLHLDHKKYFLFMITSFTLAFSAFGIGTKVASLGVLIIITMMIVYYVLLKPVEYGKKIILCSALLLLSIGAFIASPTLGNINGTYSRFGEANIEEDDEFDVVPRTKLEAFAISLLSGRERFLLRVDLVYKNSSKIDKLFGIGFTQRDTHYSRHASRIIEMDYFDAYYRFGIVGFFLLTIPFLIIIFDIIYKLLKRKLFLTLDFCKYFLIWVMITCIGFLAGHVIGSPAVSFYLGVVLLLMYRSLKEV